MKRKIILAAVCTIVALGVGISFVQNAQISSKYDSVFSVDATFYPEKKLVEIKFDDKTKMTRSVTLEILGMERSFQRVFETPGFAVAVPFDAVPQYGWRSMPVTFVVEHEEMGKIGIKIDIHNDGEPAGDVIFSEL